MKALSIAEPFAGVLPSIPEFDGKDLAEIARRMRGAMITLSHEKRVPHLGSELSCVDILAVLYWRILNVDPAQPDAPLRDRFILSKGHAAKALYVALAYRGYFELSVLETFSDAGGQLPEHPGPKCISGVEFATGSLGHGLSVGIGLSYAAKLARRDNRIFALLSDGECNEGSVWEAAMLASAQKLDRLVAIIDYNKWQATGRSQDVMALEPLAEKWRAFGWHTIEVDGHDYDQLSEALSGLPKTPEEPTAVIAHTVKGKGVSFMEDDNNWHYRIPTGDEVVSAFTELGLS